MQIALMDGSVNVMERIYKYIYTVIKYLQGGRYMQVRRTAGLGVHRQKQCRCLSVSPTIPLLQDWGQQPLQDLSLFSVLPEAWF